MKFNKPIIGIALLAIVSHACKSDVEQFIVERVERLDSLAAKKWNPLAPALNDTAIAINQVFKTLSLKPEVKTINLTTGGTYSFSNGCAIRLGASACVNAGQIATGAAQIELILLKNRGEMVLHRMETMSDGKLLESGGQIFVRITQNNQELSLVSNQSISFTFTNLNTSNGVMQLFNGIESSNGRVNWVVNRDSTSNNNVTARRDSINGFLYQLNSNRLRWINCDYFYGDTANLVKYSTQLPDSFTNMNTGVFTVFRNLNAMLALQGDSTTRKFWVPAAYRGVPSGSPVTLVSVSRLGRDSTDFRYYLGTSNVSVTSNITYPLTPVRKTLAEIRTFLTTL